MVEEGPEEERYIARGAGLQTKVAAVNNVFKLKANCSNFHITLVSLIDCRLLDWLRHREVSFVIESLNRGL